MTEMSTYLGVPDRIGRYRILSELGRGSMGLVYLAFDPNIDRNVALKIFLPFLKVGAREELELRRRFILEARAAGKLQHPGIVTVFDADSDSRTGLSFITMEWVNGPSLLDLLRESGPLPVSAAVPIVDQVAVALDAAHCQGLVHRDVKPANILIDADGRAKITDFGIAKLASMSLTSTGWLPGTPFYMSPEQIRNEGVDGRSDLYSLGAVLYQSLTGVVPFEGSSLASITYMILEIDPKPPQTINPAISDALAAVIQTALQKPPGARFQTGLEFAQALREAAAEELDEGEAAADLVLSASVNNGPGDRPDRRAGNGTVLLYERASEPVLGGERRPQPLRGADPLPVPQPAPRAPSWKTFKISLSALTILVLLLLVLTLRSEPATLAHEAGGPTAALSVLDALAVEATPVEATGTAPEAASGRESLESPARQVAPARETPVRDAPRLRAAAETSRSIDPGEPTLTPPSATLELLYRNRLKSASVSIWIDQHVAWTETVSAPPNFLKRAIGKDVWTTLPVSEGPHVIDVRVTGSEGKIDVVKRTEAEFSAGQVRRLRVVLIPPKILKLSWKDPAHG